MRRAIAALLGATALALPNANAWALTASQTAVPKKKIVTAVKTFTGSPGTADRWGEVEVAIVVKKTTTYVGGKKKSVKRRITSAKVPVYPNHTDRSILINQRALPTLIQETVRAQSARIDMVSGATDTSGAFQESLQSAILKEKAWK